MSNLQVLTKYFPIGKSETETDFIKDVFVVSDEFYKIITPASRSIRILAGNKGTGKSALLEYLLKKSEDTHVPALLMKPDDILESSFQDDDAIAVIKKTLYEALLKEIAIKVGTDLKGYVKMQDAELMEQAILSGNRDPHLLRKIFNFLAPIGKVITDFEFKEMLPKHSENSNQFERNVHNFLSKNEKTFYLLLDDIDQICLPTQQNYLEVMWGLILALQKIAESLPNVKVIVSIRSEVWRRLIQDNSGSRDQVDHFRNMVYQLLPTNNDMKNILVRRLKACIADLELNPDEVFQPFFEGEDCKLPTSGIRRRWSDYLVTSSRFRPRDTVQLVNKLANYAIDHRKDIIGDIAVEETSLEYSHERVDDLVNENESICPEIEVLIRSFYKFSDFEISAEALRPHLDIMAEKCSIKVKKNIIRNQDEELTFALWKLLYDIEFITPRINDSRESGGYRHVRPKDDSGLVSKARWNDMQKYTWEIHPCYRSFLISEQKSQHFSRKPATKQGNRSKGRNRR